jgi:hypothetical protein
MDFWRIVAALGVPGLALGVFFMLLKGFHWRFPSVPRNWVGPIIVLFLVLTSVVVLFALNRWAPGDSVSQKSGSIRYSEVSATRPSNSSDPQTVAGSKRELSQANNTAEIPQLDSKRQPPTGDNAIHQTVGRDIYNAPVDERIQVNSTTINQLPQHENQLPQRDLPQDLLPAPSFQAQPRSTEEHPGGLTRTAMVRELTVAVVEPNSEKSTEDAKADRGPSMTAELYFRVDQLRSAVGAVAIAIRATEEFPHLFSVSPPTFGREYPMPVTEEQREALRKAYLKLGVVYTLIKWGGFIGPAATAPKWSFADAGFKDLQWSTSDLPQRSTFLSAKWQSLSLYQLTACDNKAFRDLSARLGFCDSIEDLLREYAELLNESKWLDPKRLNETLEGKLGPYISDLVSWFEKSQRLVERTDAEISFWWKRPK